MFLIMTFRIVSDRWQRLNGTGLFKDLGSPIEIGPNENFPLAPQRCSISWGREAGSRELGAGAMHQSPLP